MWCTDPLVPAGFRVVTRRILQLDGAKISVSAERRFDAERDLHGAVAAHPEVLPSEDLGLGPLVSLGTELDFGAGPLDLLAADPQGRDRHRGIQAWD
jgi:hypothetical protein